MRFFSNLRILIITEINLDKTDWEFDLKNVGDVDQKNKKK